MPIYYLCSVIIPIGRNCSLSVHIVYTLISLDNKVRLGVGQSDCVYISDDSFRQSL